MTRKLSNRLLTFTLTLSLALTFSLVGGLVLDAAPVFAQADGQEYVVVPGDSLFRIASIFYGDGSLWPNIVQATNDRAAEDSRFDVITNASLLYTGQRLWIPALGSGSPLGPAAPQPVAAQRPPSAPPVVYQQPSGPCWAEPSVIQAGETATIRWNMPGALRVFAGNQEFAGPEGRTVVRPTATRTYRLLYAQPTGNEGIEQFLLCDVTVRVN